MNQELLTIFEEDQLDLKTMPVDRIHRDEWRRKRVKEMISQEVLLEGSDFFHSAVIFQHGESLEDWYLAHELAKKASELGFSEARSLAAIALDRWLVRQGKPAKYGNQLIPLGGIYRIPKVDPATTDAERRKWDMASLSDMLAFEGLHGFASLGDEVDRSDRIDGFQLKVIRLRRDLAHSPQTTGTHCGFLTQDLAIFENSYGWRWTQDKKGTVTSVWLLIPYAPVIAHIEVGIEKCVIKTKEYKQRQTIWVRTKHSSTLYYKAGDKILAISGQDEDLLLHISRQCL